MKKKLIDVIMMEKPDDMEYQVKLGTDREKIKVIKRIERIIRSSLEYSDYIRFLRENVGMDACAFFNNINKETSKSLRIEIHHTPFTLFDLVKIVLTKYIEEGLPINELFIGEEVMKLHYSNMVGLIPLSKTVHLIVHGENSEKVTIPAYMIFGNYKEFITKYKDYMEDSDFEKVETMIKRTKELKNDSYKIFEQKYDYLQVDGFQIPKRIDETGEIETDITEESEETSVA